MEHPTIIEPQASPSPLLRFFDSFLQEANIKWVLGIGTILLLGSSLMLVGNNWQHYTPTWKYLIALSYTVGIFAAGQWSYHRLALRTTGTVLMALTVLLIPVLSLALQWLGNGGGLIGGATNVVLMAVTALFAAVAAHRIFALFFVRQQPTFLAAYLGLCALAVAAPMLTGGALTATIGAGLAWALFAVGSIKVNRHVFWLTEQRRRPRIWGFFPIGLLAGQFALLFTTTFIVHVSVAWLGLIFALVAPVILIAADAQARVFSQRTGDLVRPVPAPVIVPLVIGLFVSAAGMIMAASPIAAGGLPYAAVPTGILTALSWAIVARRTGKGFFVWGALGAALTAYNFSPVFFTELARTVVSSSAAAVQESALPYAFYGFTYLPVIVGLVLLARWRQSRSDDVFGRPLELAGLGITGILFVAALTHAKAVLPVGLTMATMMVVQTRVFRRPNWGLVALIAGPTALVGLPAFAEGVLGVGLEWTHLLGIASVVAALTLVLARRFDGYLSAMDRSLWLSEPTRRLSLAITLGGGATWLVASSAGLVAFSVQQSTVEVALLGLASLGLGLAHIWRKPGSVRTSAVLVFAHLALVITLASGAVSGETIGIVSIATWLSGWLVARLLPHLTRSERVVTTFRSPLLVTSGLGLAAVFVAFQLPLGIEHIVTGTVRHAYGMPVLLRLATIVWAFDAARSLRRPVLAYGAIAGVLILAGSALSFIFGSHALSWLPTLWTGLAIAGVGVLATERLEREGVIAPAIAVTSRAVLVAIAILALAQVSLASCVSGAVATVGLWLLARQTGNERWALAASLSAAWQPLSWALYVCSGPEVLHVFALSPVATTVLWQPLSLVAAVLAVASPRLLPRLGGADEIALAHRVAMAATAIALAAGGLVASTITSWEAIVTVAAFTLLAGDQIVRVRGTDATWRVWLAQGYATLAAAYLVHYDFIRLGHGKATFILTGIAGAAWGIAHWARDREPWRALVRPLSTTTDVLPGIAAAAALVRHVDPTAPAFLGQNGLAMLLAAALYFWRGLSTRRSGFVIAAGVILNLALATVWLDLSWSDPQFFMIPVGLTVLGLTRLLNDELPQRLHDPLYYIGAAVILVSPVFNIVSGSWIHIASLMIASVSIILMAIGMRLRALIYTGSVFLLADLLAMVVRGSVDHRSVLWITGLLLGALVITLGAIAERNREGVLQRIRALQATLETWG